MAYGPIVTQPGQADFEVLAGSSFERILTISSNNSIDLSDFEFRGYIKKSFLDECPLAIFDIIHLEGENELLLRLTPTESSNLIKGSAHYDIEMYVQENNIDVYVARILQGKITIKPQVTK